MYANQNQIFNYEENAKVVNILFPTIMKKYGTVFESDIFNLIKSSMINFDLQISKQSKVSGTNGRKKQNQAISKITFTTRHLPGFSFSIKCTKTNSSKIKSYNVKGIYEETIRVCLKLDMASKLYLEKGDVASQRLAGTINGWHQNMWTDKNQAIAIAMATVFHAKYGFPSVIHPQSTELLRKYNILEGFESMQVTRTDVSVEFPPLVDNSNKVQTVTDAAELVDQLNIEDTVIPEDQTVTNVTTEKVESQPSTKVKSFTNVTYPNTMQGYPAQHYPAQPYPAQPYPVQPHAQHYQVQPYTIQHHQVQHYNHLAYNPNYSPQPFPAQPHPAQYYSAQPYSAQHYQVHPPSYAVTPGIQLVYPPNSVHGPPNSELNVLNEPPINRSNMYVEKTTILPQIPPFDSHTLTFVPDNKKYVTTPKHTVVNTSVSYPPVSYPSTYKVVTPVTTPTSTPVPSVTINNIPKS